MSRGLSRCVAWAYVVVSYDSALLMCRIEAQDVCPRLVLVSAARVRVADHGHLVQPGMTSFRTFGACTVRLPQTPSYIDVQNESTSSRRVQVEDPSRIVRRREVAESSSVWTLTHHVQHCFKEVAQWSCAQGLYVEPLPSHQGIGMHQGPHH